MTFAAKPIDDLLKDQKKAGRPDRREWLLKQLTNRLLERAMAAELTEHVG